MKDAAIIQNTAPEGEPEVWELVGTRVESRGGWVTDKNNKRVGSPLKIGADLGYVKVVPYSESTTDNSTGTGLTYTQNSVVVTDSQVTDLTTINDMSVVDAKTHLKALVDKEFDERETAGTLVNGIRFSTDGNAKAELNDAYGDPLPANSKRVIDGNVVTLDGQTVAAARNAVRNYTIDLGNNYAALYEAVDAAADLTALRAIDIKAGWPA